MIRSEKRDFLLVLAICIFIQAPDFLVSMPDYPFWSLYLFNTSVDAIAFALVYLVISRTYPVWGICILLLQSISVLAHYSAYQFECMYNLTLNQQFAQLSNLYTPTLQCILVLKTLVLGAGGYGIYRRIRDIRHNRGDYPRAIHIPNNHTTQDNSKMVESQE